MPVTKLIMPKEFLGFSLMQKHVRTVSKTVGRQRIPESEIFEIATANLGRVEVMIPTENAMKGIRFGAQVEIEELVLLPRSNVYEVNGKKRAKVEYTAVANKISVVGGDK
ncbi:hypothetical protein M2139_000533 [Enterococcus sp. PF1-24]|uniref:hypothetical protein n=1 Tax=unclassified Enterococcus TaxID=2608891 RepID=UPI002477133A|nr:MULTISPECIES: hypothetical protein [unclassified Enterococcus]MDH6363696.1 hypothetical protein [Enterococcus sp. PFB1-1]MDH6400652.1 hypothetical protein [Enterococcus sp. PF1-24]